MSRNNYGFIPMRRSQLLSVIFTVGTVAICCMPMVTQTLVMGVSLSQWIIGVVALAFPIIHMARMKIARSKGGEGL